MLIDSVNDLKSQPSPPPPPLPVSRARVSLDILDLYISKTRRRKEQMGKHKDKLARMVHNISMIALHTNRPSTLWISLQSKE